MFKLFNAASYSGTFSSVQLPSLSAGLAWNTNGLNTNGTLAVVSTAPPTPPFISQAALAGTNFTFNGTGGVANASFYLLATTNLAAPLGTWTRLLTNLFDGSGNFNLTNARDPNLPQSFCCLQLP